MTIIIQHATTAAECPSWCTGRHGAPLLPGEPPGERHLTASCPPWCIGHPEYDTELDDHTSADAKVTLSLAPAIEDPAPFYSGPDWLAVSTWRLAHENRGAPTVAIMHGADDGWLPQMTPAAAAALAVALLRTARDARHGTGTGAGTPMPAEGHPAWCSYQDAGKDCEGVHVSAGLPVPVTEDYFCSYERARKAGHTGLPCTEDNCSELVSGDDGYPLVAVHHGDDFLPHMTLPAAEELALDILGLIATARAPQGGAQ